MDSYTQSQKYGFRMENIVKDAVFGLPYEKNNTDKHDVPKEKNRFDGNENGSIKTILSFIIYCGDLLRFHDYDFNEKNTIIVLKYKQIANKKVIQNIYEIDYNEQCHKLLFGDLPRAILEDYVKKVKSIPIHTSGKEAKKIFNYLEVRDELKKKYNYKIQINPKVDSKQTRVQCSIPNFEKILKQFITYKSSDEFPNRLRGVDLVSSITSGRRARHGLKNENLKKLCRINCIHGYSKLKKEELKELLIKNNIPIDNS